MLKILIISYYSKPLNSVSSFRVESFCEEFAKQGGDITLLTRHWNETFNNWDDILSTNNSKIEINKNNGYRTIRLPYIAQEKVNKLHTIKNYISGNLQPEINAFSSFYEYALKLLQKENDFNLILVSAPPNNLVKLGYYLNKKTKVPFIVDFRDFFNQIYLIKDSKSGINDSLIQQISIYHLKKWLKNCSLIITVSPKLATIFQSIFNIKTSLVPNGYETEYFQSKSNICTPNDIFTLRYIGTAYKHQNFTVIINGLKLFQERYPNKSFKIELIGLHQVVIVELFKNNFNADILTIITNRISKKDVVNKTINSDILMLPWNNFQGVYGTKIYDYIASGSHILLCPSDEDVIESLVQSTKSGSICNNSKEVFEILKLQYAKWEKKSNKNLNCKDIDQFSRDLISKSLYNSLLKKSWIK